MRLLQKKSGDDFLTLFFQSFHEVAPNAKLASIFATMELKDKVKSNMEDAEVEKVIREEVEDAINNSFNVLRTRIDRFGVVQPNIQKLAQSGRILIELPGIKDPKRVEKLLVVLTWSSGRPMSYPRFFLLWHRSTVSSQPWLLRLRL